MSIGIVEISGWALARPRWREGAGGKAAFVSAFVLQRTRSSGAVGRYATR